MRVALVPSPYIRHHRLIAYLPLGLLSLHGVLSDAGHDCRIAAAEPGAWTADDLDAELQRWAVEILAAAPDCVGLSTTCDSYPLVLLLARTIKRLAPPTRVVLGGPQASAVAEESMAAFPWIDYVLRGEAESTILDFARMVGGEGDPESVPGLTYRSNGRILSTPLHPLLREMDSLGLPDYEAYPFLQEALVEKGTHPGEKVLPVEAGRGCPHGCVFCSTSAYWRRRRRQKTPQVLVQQLKALRLAYRAEAFALMQDLLADEGSWLAAFLRVVATGDHLKWSCSLRPDTVNAETLVAMQRAGCTHIFFGVETGSQRIQRLIRKNLDITSAVATIEAAVACGLRVITSLVVGFPWETQRDLSDTLSLHKHFLSIGVEQSLVQMHYPLPGTQITTRYGARLRMDHVLPGESTGLEDYRNAEIQRMIDQHPRIFPSFYYVEPEFVTREELLIAVWAANALHNLAQSHGG